MTETQVAHLHDTDHYTLQLPSHTDSIITAESFIERIKVRYAVDEEVYANVLTCVNEVLMNAVIHGNKFDLDKRVFLNLEVRNRKRLIFTISDEGKGFDYSHLPDPTDPENIEKLSGRGVFIMKQLADQCIFNTLGNEVELHFKF